ncbi:hypothetical protein [Mariprofundus sp. KV]|uniref:hypothetical protein n=1 Tax=Mariprofundus sp. KV TaxID=2608715 RepID=UPI0015A3749C|nr:hypothetical protein [Mariprofundus sp. KV]NWF36778.1 hypothetical protein [Mariprofundus sp. KV]
MNKLSLSLVAFLLLDELVNLFSPFSSGLGLFVFLIFFVFMHPLPLRLRFNDMAGNMESYLHTGLAAILLIFCYSLLASANSPCQGDYVFSFATMFIFTISWLLFEIYTPSLSKTKLIEPSHALVGLTLVAVFLLISTLGLDLYELLLKGKVNRPSGLYLEPSHLILYSAPLMFLSIGDQKTRPLAVLLILLICVLAFSATVAVLFSLTVILAMIHKAMNSSVGFSRKNKLIMVVVSIVLLAFYLKYEVYLVDRLYGLLDYEHTTNWSSLVYLNGWLLAYSSVYHTSGLGLGLGSMGCSELINYDRVTLADIMYPGSGGLITNLRDGSFLVSKIISELGFLGIMLLLLALLRLLQILLLGFKGKFDLELVGIIALVFTILFVRGLPYFSAVIVYSWLLLRVFVWNNQSRYYPVHVDGK